MADIFDYLSWRGDVVAEYDGFCEIDWAILSRYSYEPFEYATDIKSKDGARVEDISRDLLATPDIDKKVLMKNDKRLLEELPKTARFKDLRVFEYVNQIDMETQTQFSAVTIKLNDNEYFISFRGTDNYIVSWKENFNMCFMCPVHSQELAVQYLERVAETFDGEFIVGGHSKGGNLAAYASAFCNKNIQSRIKAVYNFDGPGFEEKIFATKGFKNIIDKVHSFVPQASVVGMMLEHQAKSTIVHSSQSKVLWQHDIYSWDVQRDGFVQMESVDKSSKFIDLTIKSWASDFDNSQRQQFFDALYTIMTETNATTLNELTENWFASAKVVLTSVKNLDEPTRKAVLITLKSLFKNAKNGLLKVKTIK